MSNAMTARPVRRAPSDVDDVADMYIASIRNEESVETRGT